MKGDNPRKEITMNEELALELYEEELMRRAVVGLWLAIIGDDPDLPFPDDMPLWIILWELTARVEYLTDQLNDLATEVNWGSR